MRITNEDVFYWPFNNEGTFLIDFETTARELYNLLKIIWEWEYVPPALVRASFIMIFKNKDSTSDLSISLCTGA